MNRFEQLDSYASSIITRIEQSLNDLGVVESIVQTYQRICRADDFRRDLVEEQPVTNDTHLRLRFECLCFATFTATLISEVYIANPDQELLEYFDGALGAKLIKHCSSLGMCDLQDIAFIRIDPNKKLDPIDRWEEYRVCFIRDQGSEAKHFGKWVGRALDPPNYLL